MIQHTFNELPPPPHNRTDTSKAAAESVKPCVGRIRSMVFDEIQRRGDATCDEVEQALSMSHQTTSARIRELTQAGMIDVTPRRRPTRTGRMARVYELPRKTP